MPEPTFGRVPFAQANAFLQRKLQLPSAHWDELRGAVHAHAFMAAGATKLQLVDDLHQAVIAARTGGETLSSFAKRFDEVVAKHGWSYRGNRAFRTRTIFQTNMATAAAAGHWEQMMRTKATRPYGMYLTADDHAVRDEHRRWHRLILPLDHPWWRTHYPPNGWGCRCTVVSLSESDLKRLGLEVSEAPDLERTDRVIGSTGEIVKDVPRGIDIGWDYNVGEAAMGPPIALGRTLATMNPAVRAQVLSPQRLLRFSRQLQVPWTPWAQAVLQADRTVAGAQAMGYLSAPVLTWLARPLDKEGRISNVVPPQQVTSALVLAERGALLRNQPKRKGQRGLSARDALLMPTLMATAEAIYWDTANGSLLYAWPTDGPGRSKKLIVRIEMPHKGEVLAKLRSGGTFESHQLGAKNFILIWRREDVGS